MELRDIEVFLTLAEELHFGRTAERLHVTPARVSQAIKKQERAIGAALFERTSRVVRLTPRANGCGTTWSPATARSARRSAARPRRRAASAGRCASASPAPGAAT